MINIRAEMPNEANRVSLFAIIKFKNKLVPSLSIDLIFDGNSEIGAHVRSILCYLICSRHLIRSRAVTNRNF